MFSDLENDVATKDVAETIKKLVSLFGVVNQQAKDLSADYVSISKSYGKSWIKYNSKLYKKVCKQSVKNILKKIPVNIEMPSLKKVGNGQVKKVYDKNFAEKPEDEEIECYSALSDSSAISGLIEDKED